MFISKEQLEQVQPGDRLYVRVISGAKDNHGIWVACQSCDRRKSISELPWQEPVHLFLTNRDTERNLNRPFLPGAKVRVKRDANKCAHWHDWSTINPINPDTVWEVTDEYKYDRISITTGEETIHVRQDMLEFVTTLDDSGTVAPADRSDEREFVRGDRVCLASYAGKPPVLPKQLTDKLRDLGLDWRDMLFTVAEQSSDHVEPDYVRLSHDHLYVTDIYVHKDNLILAIPAIRQEIPVIKD